MSSDVKRKLAAIMFTDIAGYTALSSKDENRALDLLDKQEQILTPIIEEFNGTLHNRIGDGLLFTFQTVTDAIKCGIKIQKETKEVKDLNLRIGIHEGEITLKNGDVLFLDSEQEAKDNLKNVKEIIFLGDFSFLLINSYLITLLN